MKSSLLLLLVSVFLISCQKNQNINSIPNSDSTSIRDLTTSEALEDFEILVSKFKNFYGPLEYKEQRFGFDFDQLVSDYRQKFSTATSEAEYFGLIAKFLSEFNDAHVGYRFPFNSTKVSGYKIPLFIVPFEKRAIVAKVEDKLSDSGIAVGDELLSVDGESPFEILKVINTYHTFGNPKSDLHWLFKVLNREFFMTDILPTKNVARLVFKKADGSEFFRDIKWDVVPMNEKETTFVTDRLSSKINLEVPSLNQLKEASKASLMEMARPKPFFATDQVITNYFWLKVEADEAHRKKFGLKDEEKPDIYAYLYKYQDKTILLVRNFIYSHSDFSNEVYMKGYKAILDQWEEKADVLVLDQTHNGGGSYCVDFFSLFIQKEEPGFVQACNADRLWISELGTEWPKFMKGEGMEVEVEKYQLMAKYVEQAYDNGENLSHPIPLITAKTMQPPNKDYTWKKPMLVLIDELALSCGDAFPTLIQRNNVAKMFGQKTGGAGGNVESIEPLPHTRANINLTRGLFTVYDPTENYSNPNWVENNGATPDYEYDHTVDDFRAGFINYVKEFSDKALEQIKE